MDPELERRFWDRVERSEGCWRWTGHIATNGYGRFTFRGRSHSATRLALLTAGVVVPAGRDACHTCDNRWCVNRDHLYVGTRRQNMADCTLRGRHNKPRGETHWRARLSAADVAAIRARRRSGETVTALGRAFGVHHATISRVARGIWRQEVAL